MLSLKSEFFSYSLLFVRLPVKYKFEEKTGSIWTAYIYGNVDMKFVGKRIRTYIKVQKFNKIP